MNFKKEYQEAFSKVQVDEAFKQRLINDMSGKTVSYKKKNPYMGMVVAAAAMVLVVGAGYFATGLKTVEWEEPGNNLVKESSGKEDSDSKDAITNTGNEILADGDASGGYVKLDIPSLSWYGDAEGAEEILEAFLKMAEDDADIELYCFEDDDFREGERLDEKEAEELLEDVANAVGTEKEFVGETQYYEAVFGDNSSVKFMISQKGYLKFEDVEYVYHF